MESPDHQKDALLFDNVPLHLCTAGYDDIHQLMVEQGTQFKDVYIRGGLLSFTDQMARATRQADPDYFLLTANSAIPVADAVRGYYTVIGRSCPPIGPIYVKSTLWNEPIEQQTAYIRKEAARLEPFIEGLGNIALIDQFTNSGHTLDMCREIVHDAGATVRTALRGNWYHDADPDEIDLPNMTSAHKDFMLKVGRDAATKVLAGDYNIRSKIRIGIPGQAEELS